MTCSLVICATLVICAVVIALVVRRSKRQVLKMKEEEGFEDKWEVKRKDVNIGTELGKGCFGTVYKGSLKKVKRFDVKSLFRLTNFTYYVLHRRVLSFNVL